MASSEITLARFSSCHRPPRPSLSIPWLTQALRLNPPAYTCPLARVLVASLQSLALLISYISPTLPRTPALLSESKATESSAPISPNANSLAWPCSCFCSATDVGQQKAPREPSQQWLEKMYIRSVADLILLRKDLQAREPSLQVAQPIAIIHSLPSLRTAIMKSTFAAAAVLARLAVAAPAPAPQAFDFAAVLDAPAVSVTGPPVGAVSQAVSTLNTASFASSVAAQLSVATASVTGQAASAAATSAPTATANAKRGVTVCMSFSLTSLLPNAHT